MRLKEFIIFIIIFTIVYFLLFAVYDYFNLKKTNEKYIKKKNEALNYDRFILFAKFYEIEPTISFDNLKLLYNELINNLNINLSMYSNKYQISTMELIVIVLFLEYIEVINKRKIIVENDTTTLLSSQDEELIANYSLLFEHKIEYKDIVGKMGFSSPNDIKYLVNNYLTPGIKLDNENLIYYGDEYED